MKQMTVGILSAVVLVAVLIQPAKAQSIQLNLAPHGSKLIENHYLFALDATCNIQGTEKSNTVTLHVIEKSGVVNGKHLKKGQSTSVKLKNHDALSVHAEPGSVVNISNLSDDRVLANCSV